MLPFSSGLVQPEWWEDAIENNLGWLWYFQLLSVCGNGSLNTVTQVLMPDLQASSLVAENCRYFYSNIFIFYLSMKNRRKEKWRQDSRNKWRNTIREVQKEISRFWVRFYMHSFGNKCCSVLFLRILFSLNKTMLRSPVMLLHNTFEDRGKACWSQLTLKPGTAINAS